MSDDERLERLTELAQRVYGSESTVSVHGKVARVEHGPAIMLHVYGERCADALEAALLVLLGEPPLWVETLAAKWDQRADAMPPFNVRRVAFRDCAAELRRRAKGAAEHE